LLRHDIKRLEKFKKRELRLFIREKKLREKELRRLKKKIEKSNKILRQRLTLISKLNKGHPKQRGRKLGSGKKIRLSLGLEDVDDDSSPEESNDDLEDAAEQAAETPILVTSRGRARKVHSGLGEYVVHSKAAKFVFTGGLKIGEPKFVIPEEVKHEPVQNPVGKSGRKRGRPPKIRPVLTAQVTLENTDCDSTTPSVEILSSTMALKEVNVSNDNSTSTKPIKIIGCAEAEQLENSPCLDNTNLPTTAKVGRSRRVSRVVDHESVSDAVGNLQKVVDVNDGVIVVTKKQKNIAVPVTNQRDRSTRIVRSSIKKENAAELIEDSFDYAAKHNNCSIIKLEQVEDSEAHNQKCSTEHEEPRQSLTEEDLVVPIENIKNETHFLPEITQKEIGTKPIVSARTGRRTLSVVIKRVDENISNCVTAPSGTVPHTSNASVQNKPATPISMYARESQVQTRGIKKDLSLEQIDIEKSLPDNILDENEPLNNAGKNKFGVKLKRASFPSSAKKLRVLLPVIPSLKDQDKSESQPREVFNSDSTEVTEETTSNQESENSMVTFKNKERVSKKIAEDITEANAQVTETEDTLETVVVKVEPLLSNKTPSNKKKMKRKKRYMFSSKKNSSKKRIEKPTARILVQENDHSKIVKKEIEVVVPIADFNTAEEDRGKSYEKKPRVSMRNRTMSSRKVESLVNEFAKWDNGVHEKCSASVESSQKKRIQKTPRSRISIPKMRIFESPKVKLSPTITPAKEEPGKVSIPEKNVATPLKVTQSTVTPSKVISARAKSVTPLKVINASAKSVTPLKGEEIEERRRSVREVKFTTKFVDMIQLAKQEQQDTFFHLLGRAACEEPVLATVTELPPEPPVTLPCTWLPGDLVSRFFKYKSPVLC